MLSVQTNAKQIVAAAAANTVVLSAPRGAITSEHYLAAGHTLLDMVADKQRLQPSYWHAQGGESPDVIETLDRLAAQSEALYFAIQFEPGIDVPAALSTMTSATVAAAVRTRHFWVNIFMTLRPNDEFVAGMGAWLYLIREEAYRQSAASGAPMRAVELAVMRTG